MKGRVTKTGYRRNSPDVNNDYNIIPSNRISMVGVNFPVLGIDNLGNSELMYPGGEYEFQGDYVTELPAYGSGGLTQWFAEKWVDIKTGKECGRSGKDKNGRPYPACRPSKRVNSTTPKTSSEMSASEKAKFKRKKKSGKRIDYNHKRAQEGIEVPLNRSEVFNIPRKMGYEDGKMVLQDKPIWDGMLDEVTITPYTSWQIAFQERWDNKATGGLDPVYPIFEALTLGLKTPVTAGAKAIKSGIKKAPSKLNPKYYNPNTVAKGNPDVMYRQVGKDAYQDFANSGFVRTKAEITDNPISGLLKTQKEIKDVIRSNKEAGAFQYRHPTDFRAPFFSRGKTTIIKDGGADYLIQTRPDRVGPDKFYSAQMNVLYGDKPVVGGFGIMDPMYRTADGFDVFKKSWWDGYKQIKALGGSLHKRAQEGTEVTDDLYYGALNPVDVTFDKNTGENILNQYPYYNQLSSTDLKYFNNSSAIGRGVRRRGRVGDQSLYGEFESGAKSILNTAAEYSGLAGSARFTQDPKANLIGAGQAIEKFMLGTNPMASSFLNTEITPEETEQFFNTLDIAGVAGVGTGPLKTPVRAGAKVLQTAVRNPGRMATNRIAKATMPMYKQPYRSLDLDGASSFVTKKPMTFTHVSKNPGLHFDDIKTVEPISIGRRSRGGKRINRKVKTGESDPRNALSGFYTTSNEAGVRSSPAGVLRPGQSSYRFKMPEGSKVLELPGTSNMSTGNMQEALDMGYDFIKGNDYGTGVEYLPLNKSKMQGFYKEGVEAELARRASKQPLALPEPITYYRATTPEKFSGIMNPISTSGKPGSMAENLRFFTPNKNVASSYLNKEGVGVTARMNINKPFIQEQNRILTNEFVQNLMDQGYDAIQTLPFDGSKNLRDAFEVVPLNKNILSNLKQAKFQTGGEESILPPAIRNMYPKEDPIYYDGMLAETTVNAAAPTKKPGVMDFVNYRRQTGEAIPEASPYHHSHSPAPINTNFSFIGVDKSSGISALRGLARGIKKGVSLIKGSKVADEAVSGFNYKRGVGNPYENMKVNDDLFSGRHDYGIDYDGQIEAGRLGFVRNLGKELDDIKFDANWMGPEHLRFHGTPYGRSVVEVAVPGKTHQTQLFYKSSALGNKAGEGVNGSTQGLWQPYGGHATKLDFEGPIHEWFIKGDDYKSFYNSKSFKDIAGRLDDLTKEAGFDMSGQAYKYQTGRQVGPPSLTPGPIQDKVYPMVTGPVEDSLENRIVNAKSSAPKDFSRRDALLNASKRVSEGQGGRPLEVLLNMTAVMENSLGDNPKAYGRDYTRSQMSIDDNAYADLFEPRGEYDYTSSQKKGFEWLKGMGYEPAKMDSILRTDDPVAAMAAARLVYGRAPDALPNPDSPKEVYSYYMDNYNKSGALKYGDDEKHYKRFLDAYNNLYQKETGGESIPVYNTYDSKNRAWLAARKNLGRGKQFMYGGKVYSTSTPNGL